MKKNQSEMNNTITEIKKRKAPRGNYQQIRYYRRIQKQSGGQIIRNHPNEMWALVINNSNISITYHVISWNKFRTLM